MKVVQEVLGGILPLLNILDCLVCGCCGLFCYVVLDFAVATVCISNARVVV